MKQYTLCIIGMGISGIAVTRWAKEYNINMITLEKSSSIGGCWVDKSYPNVILQSLKNTYSFSDIPMPESYSQYPTREDILKYLNFYYNHHKLYRYTKFNSTVILTEWNYTNNNWIITYKNKNKKYKIISKYLCICSGFYTTPKIPNFKNMEKYKGKIKHSSDWSYTGKETLTSFNNKKILIIGNGPSGCDLACLAVKNKAKDVILLGRSHRWIFERNFYNLFSVSYFANRLMVKIKEILPNKLAIIYLIIYNILYYLIKNYNIKILNPTHLISRTNITLNEEISNFINKKYIKYYNGEIKEFTKDNIKINITDYNKISNSIFKTLFKSTKTNIKNLFEFNKNNINNNNNIKLDPDLVIMCTGYNQNISFLNYKKIPKLYKRIISPVYNNCGFIGFVATFNWVQISDLQARWFIQYIKGNIKLPDKNKMLYEISKEKNKFKNNNNNKNNNNDFHDYSYKIYKYADNLASDMNIIPKKKRKKNYNRLNHYFKLPDYNEWI
tara:strand:- start:801 stop:2297 length:1497 start_codon:yes stop_codon:yes gene_type:complete